MARNTVMMSEYLHSGRITLINTVLIIFWP